MKLYEIDALLKSLIDHETGEILNIEAFHAIGMEKEKKIEGIALWIKNLLAEAKMLKDEKDVLAKRERVAANKAASLKEYLNFFLGGKEFKTSKVALTYKSSKAVELDDDFVSWAQGYYDYLLNYKAPEPDKKAIKEALEEGAEIKGATLIERMNLQIK